MGRVRFDSGSFQEDSKAGSVGEYELRADLTTEIKKTCINRSEKLRHKKAILGLHTFPPLQSETSEGPELG